MISHPSETLAAVVQCLKKVMHIEVETQMQGIVNNTNIEGYEIKKKNPFKVTS